MAGRLLRNFPRTPISWVSGNEFREAGWWSVKGDLAHINGAMLRWAREAAGLSLDDAVARARMHDTKSVSAAVRLQSWEEGRDLPTQNQLDAIANAYHRPILTFYLSAPPVEDHRVADFRTVADAGLGRGVSPNFDALLRRMKARQRQVREILEDDESERLPFVGAFKGRSDAIEIVRDIRRLLSFDPTEQKRLGDADDVFRVLRTRLEDIGIFVQLVGNLGSHHTRIEPEEFRGIALVDDIAPFIVVNANDSKAANLFTLMHEAAHIWLGESGISNSSPFAETVEDTRDESLCNTVAAEFLLPRVEFLRAWRKIAGAGTIATLVELLSRDWKLSRAAVALRLWKLGEIGDDVWWPLYRGYQEEWRRIEEKMKDKDGGPTYPVITKSHLGAALIRTVLNAVESGSVTYTKAANILSVRTQNFDSLR